MDRVCSTFAREQLLARTGVDRPLAGNYARMNNDPYNDERVTEGDVAAPNGSREERLSRLDQLERDIAAERERLNQPEPDTRQPAGSRHGGQQREQFDTVREVELPDLEAKVTESQREAWRLGYEAGLSDARADGQTTANPFHPLRQNTV